MLTEFSFFTKRLHSSRFLHREQIFTAVRENTFGGGPKALEEELRFEKKVRTFSRTSLKMLPEDGA